MKRLFTLLVLFCTFIGSWAYDAKIDGIYYNLDSGNKTAEVTYMSNEKYPYSFNMDAYIGNVVIPSIVTYNGITYSVTSIGYQAFYDCSGLTSVTIPNSVTSIGYAAFSGCSGLTSVTIPNSVKSIEEHAFDGCSGLTSVTIPNSVTSIGRGAFSGCSSLPVIDGFRYADTYLVELVDKSLTDVTIKEGTRFIGSYAFYTCSGLTSAAIGNSVTSIGDYAFYNCYSLTSVTIPNSVTSIGDQAFRSCSGLTSVTIPNSVTSIGDQAFRSCSGLTSVTIPNSVTSIGNDAFRSCSGLTSVTIGNSVTSIGIYAFENCSGLTSVTIPNSVTSIRYGAFKNCSGLTSIVVEKGNSIYDNRNDCNAIIETNSNTLVVGCKNTIIPNSVTSIGEGAFYECDGLISVTIPNSVTSIGKSAFDGCSGLTSVTIPNSVTSIGQWAFSDCSGLTSVDIPNSVTSIGDRAFQNCSGLTSVTNLSTTPQVITSGVFTTYGTLHVLPGYGDTYRSADYWKNFTIVEDAVVPATASGDCGAEGDNVKWYYYEDSKKLVISGSGAMANFGYGSSPWYSFCNSIESVEIQNGVTSIGDWAFYNCSGLTSLTIPNSVMSIGTAAFWGCSGLTSVTIPNSVTSIANYAFYGCTGLTSVTIPNSVTSIGESVFSGCSGLTSVTIPNSVTSIGDRAFQNCSGLTSVNIPNSVTSIGEWAFAGCSKLTSVTIPNSVTSIGSWAFLECSSLTSVTIPNSVTSIGNEAFAYCSGLTSIVVENDNRIYDSRNGCNAIIETASNTLTTGCLTTTIPNSVTSIESWAFSGCSGLTSVTIPNSVTSIGNYAFHYCSGLTSVTIPNSVTSIGERAFSYCSGLTSVTIPNSVTSIGNYAFASCWYLTSVTIPNSVTSIGQSAFFVCSGLTSVTNLSTTPQVITSDVFTTYGTLHVPYGCGDAYRAADYWKKFAIVEDAGLDGNTYYFYNEEGDGFLQRGNNWGTHATVGNYGLPVHITKAAGGYTLSMLDWEGTCIGFDGDIYTDAWGDNARTYTATYKNGGFVFTNNNGYVMTIQGTDVNGVQGSEGTVWKLLNQEERDAIVAAKAEAQMAEVLSEGGVSTTDGLVEYDCTDKVASASLKNGYEGWTWTYVPSRGSASNLRSTAEGFECWEGAGKLTQTVTGLEPGLYKVSVNALYRDGSCEKMNTLAQDGYNISTAYIAANGYSAQVTPWYVCRESDGYPNTMGQFATMVSADPSKYLNEVITYVGNDGVLELELVCTQYNNGGWLMASDLKLARLKKEIHLVDGTSFHNDTEDEFETIKYTRNFKNTSMQALFVPFELSYDDWADNFVVYTLNNVTQYDTDGDEVLDATNLYVNKVKEGHTLKANHPYIIKAINTGEYTFTLSDATLYPSTDLRSISCSTLDNEYIFQGTYTPFSGMYEQGGYALANGQMSPASSPSATLNPYRWYMTIRSRDSQFSQGNVQEAKSFRIVVLGEDEDEETVITELAEDAVPVEYVGINGLRSATPLKGMNIVKMSDGSTRKMYIK